jgi:hypothetical protein
MHKFRTVEVVLQPIWWFSACSVCMKVPPFVLYFCRPLIVGLVLFAAYVVLLYLLLSETI